jgi:hypothetical protein
VIRRLAWGDWQPRTTHPILLAVQLVTCWQAALRGLDYLDGTSAGLDTSAGDPTYGVLLYGCTALVLLGLAFRRGAPVILGHALIGSWYAGLGFATLRSVGVILDGWAWVGLLTGTLGTVALLSGRHRLPVRVAGALGMLGGLILLVDDLGVDYRTGTGLVSAAFLHGVLAVGTFVLWQRERLRRVVDREPA